MARPLTWTPAQDTMLKALWTRLATAEECAEATNKLGPRHDAGQALRRIEKLGIKRPAGKRVRGDTTRRELGRARDGVARHRGGGHGAHFGPALKHDAFRGATAEDWERDRAFVRRLLEAQLAVVRREALERV